MATPSSKDNAKILEIIAANTMCTREAIDVTLRIIRIWIVLSAIGVVTSIIFNTITSNSRDITSGQIVCFGVMVIVGLIAVFYPLVLISELHNFISHVRKDEEFILNKE